VEWGLQEALLVAVTLQGALPRTLLLEAQRTRTAPLTVRHEVLQPRLEQELRQRLRRRVGVRVGVGVGVANLIGVASARRSEALLFLRACLWG
jgi:hypothetical protein